MIERYGNLRAVVDARCNRTLHKQDKVYYIILLTKITVTSHTRPDFGHHFI